MAPKLTIITVSFNSQSTIGAALDSVARQDYPLVEHIVIDGASTDGTLEVIERYRDQLTTVISEPDLGIYDAMNKGIRHASGDFIAFLNSDDIYAHEHVLSQIAKIIEDSGTEAVFADVEFVRAQSPNTVVRRYSSARFSPARLRDGWMMAHPSLFLSRKVFSDVGPFDPSYRICGDFELVVRAFKNDRVDYVYLPEVVVRMTMGGASTSGLSSLYRMNLEVMRACRANGIKTSWARLFARYPAKMLEYLLK